MLCQINIYLVSTITYDDSDYISVSPHDRIKCVGDGGGGVRDGVGGSGRGSWSGNSSSRASSKVGLWRIPGRVPEKIPWRVPG